MTEIQTGPTLLRTPSRYRRKSISKPAPVIDNVTSHVPPIPTLKAVDISTSLQVHPDPSAFKPKVCKHPPSTVFDPLKSFLLELDKSTGDKSTAEPLKKNGSTDNLNISEKPDSFHDSDQSKSVNVKPFLNNRTEIESSHVSSSVSQSVKTVKTNAALFNSTSDPHCASKPSSFDTMQLSSKTATLQLDSPTASSELPSNCRVIKFQYPSSNSSFTVSLTLDQSFADVVKTVVTSSNSILPTTDPDDYILWEVCPSLSLRRALRSTEYLSFVYKTWPAATSNYFEIDSYETRFDVFSIASLTPRRDIVQSAGPSGPTFYTRCYYRVGKTWKRTHVLLHNGTLTISRKSPGEMLTNKDKRTISQISQFDIYEVTENFGPHPGRYIMAIRSQLHADVVVDKKDCLHMFATDDPNDYSTFQNIVFTLRSRACEKMVRDYKDRLSKFKPVGRKSGSLPVQTLNPSVSLDLRTLSPSDNDSELNLVSNENPQPEKIEKKPTYNSCTTLPHVSEAVDTNSDCETNFQGSVTNKPGMNSFPKDVTSSTSTEFQFRRNILTKTSNNFTYLPEADPATMTRPQISTPLINKDVQLNIRSQNHRFQNCDNVSLLEPANGFVQAVAVGNSPRYE